MAIPFKEAPVFANTARQSGLQANQKVYKKGFGVVAHRLSDVCLLSPENSQQSQVQHASLPSDPPVFTNLSAPLHFERYQASLSKTAEWLLQTMDGQTEQSLCHLSGLDNSPLHATGSDWFELLALVVLSILSDSWHHRQESLLSDALVDCCAH